MVKEVTFLFEGQSYSKDDLKDSLPDNLCDKVLDDGKVSFIGYCQTNRGRTFILPKVFVDNEGRAFHKAGLKADSPIKESQISGMKDVLNVLPVWLGKALSFYRARNSKSQIVKSINQKILRHTGEEDDTTLYEKIYSLEDFYRANKDLFLFVYEQTHSGYNKINWTKTIHTKQPFICGSTVAYLDLVTRKKTVNYDEELMVLYFSTLQYIYNEFEYLIADECYYNLVSDDEFKDLAESGNILSMLEDIKGNYFSDRLSELWSLLYAFHKSLDNLNGHDDRSEYMLVNKFEAVFEDMMDSLISDQDSELFTKKHQDDDKRIDHLFLGKSLFNPNEQIYYIGDSKYYSESNKTSDTSVAKQYTYARNLIQDAIDNKDTWGKPYRDGITEGYNVIPNFFIRGMQGEDYDSHNLTQFEMEKGRFYDEKTQFEGRLFDRDTFFLLQYSINFLYVLKNYNDQYAYGNNDAKRTLAEEIRSDYIDRLNSKYIFAKYEILEKKSFENAVQTYFKILAGKVMLFAKEEKHPFFIVAVPNVQQDVMEKIKEKLSTFLGFHEVEFSLT